VVAFAQALIEAAPDRMVWGSDWPHVGLYDPAAVPDVGRILEGLADYTNDPEQQRRILVSNPARFRLSCRMNGDQAPSDICSPFSSSAELVAAIHT
jgi:hypothetical protein